MMIPTVQMAINVPNSFGLIAFFSIMSDGRLSVVTAIIKLKIVPSKAPLYKSASAIGIGLLQVSLQRDFFPQALP